MTSEFIKSLGWKFEYLWNNRDIYSYKGKSILEHCGNVFPLTSKINYDCNFTEDQLKQYTSIIDKLYDITNNPDQHTLLEFQTAQKEIKTFVKTCIKKNREVSEAKWKEEQKKLKKSREEEILSEFDLKEFLIDLFNNENT